MGVISGTGCPPPSGTRLALVIVAMNDSTSQVGASVPKVTTEPEGVGVGVVESEAVPPFDPHPIIIAATKTVAPPAKNRIFLLLIHSS